MMMKKKKIEQEWVKLEVCQSATLELLCRSTMWQEVYHTGSMKYPGPRRYVHEECAWETKPLLAPLKSYSHRVLLHLILNLLLLLQISFEVPKR
jgi:hypothetical protein